MKVIAKLIRVIFGDRWGRYEKKFVPLQPKRLQNRRMRQELSHGTAEDQSDMMKTTNGNDRAMGRYTAWVW